MNEKTYFEQLDEDARAYQRRLRAEAEAKKSGADKLRDRLRYVDRLREKSRAAKALAEFLNLYTQDAVHYMSSDYKVAPMLVRARKTLTILFGKRTLTLSKREAEALFTWALDHSKKVGENADSIEAELADSAKEQETA